MNELPESNTKWRRPRQLLPIFAVAGIGLILSFAAWFVVSLGGERFAETEFSTRAWIVLAAGVLISAALVAYMWVSELAKVQVSELARTDPLTALANRRAFLERLTQAIAAIKRGGRPFAVLSLDLDGFKNVNDTLGHPIGDALLREVAERLRKSIREVDLVARFGGDEFAILQMDATDSLAAGTLADRVARTLAAPYTIGGNEVHVSASIGISLYSTEVAGPEAVMTQADLALYRAKEDGRNCFRFHNESLDRQVHERMTFADELHVAIERGELEVYYQPQVTLNSGRIIGVEALICWNHPKRGLLLPSIFIPTAERSGSILPLGQWLFADACRQLRLWHDQGIAPPVVGVSISAVQFKNPSALKIDVAESLSKWGVNPGNFEFGLTESALMEVVQKHNVTLEHLRKLGVRIAIENFGAGYSSLNYLMTHHVNRLKVTQDLVFRVTADSRNAAVVRAAIGRARELGIEVVAEGAETEAHVSFLISAGCEIAQGSYYSRPVSAERMTELLRRRIIDPAQKSGQIAIQAAA
jgi:diguanylate cyclase (GGDEF)-like protein